VANTWKIGRRDVGDGVLLIVAKNDRSLRIEVAKTLEGALPDLAAKRIIEQAITPLFRHGRLCRRPERRCRANGGPHRGRRCPPRMGQHPDTASAAGFPVVRPADLPGVRLADALPQWRAACWAASSAPLPPAPAWAAGIFSDRQRLLAGLAGVAGLVYALVAGFATPTRRSGWRTGAAGIGTGHAGGWSGGGNSSWGGGGGGGFSSGGGGDFGGGGASGNW
jgi:uncharacterized protein